MGRPRGTIYKLANGRWRVQITLGYRSDGKQIRKSATAATRKEAEKKYDELRARWVGIDAEEDPLLSEWCLRWLDELYAPRVKPRSYYTVSGVVRRLVKYCPPVKLQDVEPKHVRTMYVAMAAEGVTPASLQRIHITLKTIFRDAVLNGVLRESPMDRVVKPAHKAAERPILSVEDARKVLEKADEVGDSLALLWRTALFTGARRGELLGLEWGRVSEADRTLEISWQAQHAAFRHGPGCGCDPGTSGTGCPVGVMMANSDLEVERLSPGGTRVLQRPKSASGLRLIPISQGLADRFAQARAGAGGSRFVWEGRDAGLPFTETALTYRWAQALERAGVGHVPFHSLRHTTASMLVQSGVPEMIVIKVLGHRTIASTERYVHASTEWMRGPFESLEVMVEG